MQPTALRRWRNAGPAGLRRAPRLRAWGILAAVLALALVASTRAAGRELTVFAAASLREAFTELGQIFEEQHPGVRIAFNFAGSQELRLQLENGAPADVFASADQKQLQALGSANLVGAARTFARNRPVLVVPKGNPAGLRSFGDLPQAKRIVLGAPEVPIGAYTLRLLDAASRRAKGFRAAVEAHVASRELNVRQVLAKVSLGEADAAIVYQTDALAAGSKVETIAIPAELETAELQTLAEYPIAIAVRSGEPALARDFVELVLSPRGQALLVGRGFLSGTAQ